MSPSRPLGAGTWKRRQAWPHWESAKRLPSFRSDGGVSPAPRRPHQDSGVGRTGLLMSYKRLDEGRFTPPFVPTLELSPWPEPAPNCSQPWKSGRNGHRTWPSLTRGERACCVRCDRSEEPPSALHALIRNPSRGLVLKK